MCQVRVFTPVLLIHKQLLRCGDEDKVVEWLESTGYYKGKICEGDKVTMINQALLEAVQHNRLNIAKLLLEYGASTFQHL